MIPDRPRSTRQSSRPRPLQTRRARTRQRAGNPIDRANRPRSRPGGARRPRPPKADQLRNSAKNCEAKANRLCADRATLLGKALPATAGSGLPLCLVGPGGAREAHPSGNDEPAVCGVSSAQRFAKLTFTGAAPPSGKSETVTHASSLPSPKREPWVADFSVAIGYLRSGWSRVRGALAFPCRDDKMIAHSVHGEFDEQRVSRGYRRHRGAASRSRWLFRT